MPLALGLPNFDKPFHLYCHENNGIAAGILGQSFASLIRPIAYFSCQLDPVASGMPPCLRAVAAAATLIDKASTLTLGSPIHLYVPHSVSAILQVHRTQHVSTRWQTTYEQALLTNPSIILHRCNTLNPATLLPLPDDGEPHSIPHDCLATIEMVSKPWEDLSDIPLDNPDLLLFCDGSCKRNSRGTIITGYAIVSPHETLEAYSWPTIRSAQAAELIALTRACTLAKEKLPLFTQTPNRLLESAMLLAQFGNPVDS